MTKIAGVVQTLKKEHDRLTRELKGISAALSAFGASYRANGGTHKISAAGRARIAAAQRVRWAKASSNGSKAERSLKAEEADFISRSTEENCCSSTRSMGKSKGREEISLKLRSKV